MNEIIEIKIKETLNEIINKKSYIDDRVNYGYDPYYKAIELTFNKINSLHDLLIKEENNFSDLKKVLENSKKFWENNSKQLLKLIKASNNRDEKIIIQIKILKNQIKEGIKIIISHLEHATNEIEINKRKIV